MIIDSIILDEKINSFEEWLIKINILMMDHEGDAPNEGLGS